MFQFSEQLALNLISLEAFSLTCDCRPAIRHRMTWVFGGLNLIALELGTCISSVRP